MPFRLPCSALGQEARVLGLGKWEIKAPVPACRFLATKSPGYSGVIENYSAAEMRKVPSLGILAQKGLVVWVG